MQLRTTEASRAFAALLSVMSRLEQVLTAEMESETGMTLDRYGILLVLAQADGGVMRPSELADSLPLTRSGTTRLIDRLEADGLVERRTCDADKRGCLIGLTPAGQEEFRRAGRVHLRGIDEHLGSHVSAEDLSELSRILERVAAGLGAGAPSGSTSAVS